MLQPAVAIPLMAVSMIMVEERSWSCWGSRAGRVLRLAVWIMLRRAGSRRRDGAAAIYQADVYPPAAAHPCVVVGMVAVEMNKEVGRKELELVGQSSGARSGWR
jgi:hypothetical protein